jgi:hypothetical protein
VDAEIGRLKRGPSPWRLWVNPMVTRRLARILSGDGLTYYGAMRTEGREPHGRKPEEPHRTYAYEVLHSVHGSYWDLRRVMNTHFRFDEEEYQGNTWENWQRRHNTEHPPTATSSHHHGWVHDIWRFRNHQLLVARPEARAKQYGITSQSAEDYYKGMPWPKTALELHFGSYDLKQMHTVWVRKAAVPGSRWWRTTKPGTVMRRDEIEDLHEVEAHKVGVSTKAEIADLRA